MSDNHGAESSATVAITVAGVNDAPVAVDDDVTGGVGESVVLDFNGSVNLSDYLDYAFTGFTHYVSAFGDGDNTMAYTYYNNNVASLNGADGAIGRADGEDFSLDGFRARSYTRNHDVTVLGYDDGALVASQALSLTPSYQTFTFGAAWSNVDEVRFDMSPSDYSYTFLDNIDLSHDQGPSEDISIDIDVLANDTDVDASDTVSVSAFDATSASGAAISLNADGTLHYDPTAATTLQALAPGESATDTFSYTITDGNGGTDTATVTVEVNGVNDAPVAEADAFSGTEDTPIAGNVLANDSDIEGDALSVANAGTFASANGGTVTMQANGDFTYDPAADFNGADSFEYVLSDGTDTVTSTVTLDLEAVNDGPTIAFPGLSGGDVRVAVTYGNSGSYGAGLIVNQLNDDTHFDFTATAVHYSNADNLAELSNYDAVVHGGRYYDAMSAQYFAALRDYVEADAGGVVTTGFYGYTMRNYLSGQSRADADFVSPVAYGTVNSSFGFENNRTLLFDTGHAITDGVASATVSGWSYYSANLLDADAVSLGTHPGYFGSYYQGYTAAYSDGDGLGNRAYLGGQFTENWDRGALRSGAFDQLLEQTVNWAAEGGGGTDEDTPLTITGITITDVDAGGDTIEVSLSVANGSLALNDTAGLGVGDGDGSDGTLSVTGSQAAINAALANGLVYTPDANFNGTDTLTGVADDLGHNGTGGPLVTTASADITVNAVNDAPVAGADAFSGTEDTPITGNVLANDSDIDGDALSVANAGTFATASGGTVTMQANGDFTYDPAADFNGADSLEYVLSDGTDTVTSTVTLDLEAVNDGPTIAFPGLSGGEVRVAVTYGNSGSWGAGLIVNQLNDDTYFDFTATAVHYSNADSLAELSNYDVVVHGGLYYDAMSTQYYAALRDYVEADAGGVVTTGLYGYTMRNYLSGQSRADADFVSPVAYGTVNSSYGRETNRTLLFDTGHAITDGVASATVSGWSYFSANLLDADAVSLGTNPGAFSGSYYQGYTAAYSEGDGLGNRAYLGGEFAYSFDGGGLRSGAFDQLLEQAVNWAASGGGGTDEDTPLTITGITITDVDAGGDTIEVSLSVANGSLALNDTAGLGLIDGDGSDGTLSVTGSQAAINAALANGLVYTPDANFNGTDTLTVVADDLGHNGTGGPLVTTASAEITVNAVNDAPVAGGDSAATDEDTRSRFRRLSSSPTTPTWTAMR